MYFSPRILFYHSERQTVQTLMKCHTLWHFIWALTVCQRTPLGGFRIQRYWSPNPDHFLISWFLFIFYQGDPNVPSFEIGISADPDSSGSSLFAKVYKGSTVLLVTLSCSLFGKLILVCILQGISKCTISWNPHQCKPWWNATICSISSWVFTVCQSTNLRGVPYTGVNRCFGHLILITFW